MQPTETEVSSGINGGNAGSESREDPLTGTSINIESALKSLRSEIDNLNLDLAYDKTRTWVREHPVLAIGAAIGIGLATAAVVSSLMEDEEPSRTQVLGDAVRNRVSSASETIKSQASDLNESFGKHASDLSDRIVDSISPLTNGNGVRNTVDAVEESIGSAITRTVKAAAAAAVVQKLSDWIKQYSK